MATPSINSVPADLVLEIMARLPVKSLMRLRLVSKSFFSNTAAPNFVTSHLALSKSSRYVAMPYNSPPSYIVILKKSFFEVLRIEIPFILSPQSESVRCLYSLVGSCNGLLCVTDGRMDYPSRDVVLWNPMIGKFKLISDTSLDSNMLRHTKTKVTLGFGYDEKNDDYKIVRIVILPDETEPSPQAEIYSLKTNSWKRVIFPTNYLHKIAFFERRCSFVQGALHWLVYGRGEIDRCFIFSFKIDEEQFKVIRLPPNYNRGLDFYCRTELMVLKESLALTMFYEVYEVMERRWVWKYEEDESWTKQILPMATTEVYGIHGFTEDGELMFRKNGNEVSLYNLDTGALKQSFMLRNLEYVALFRESLVLL